MRRIGIVAIVGLAWVQAATAAPLNEAVRAWRAQHEAQIVGQLDALTRIPSVAADPAGLDAAADALQSLLKARGFATQLLSAEPGAPKVVFGRLDSPGAKRTVVFYAHYDGQPVVRAQWASDPFTPTMRTGPLADKPTDVDWRGVKTNFDPEWRLYGRAAADDKASITAFLAAFDALKAAGRKPSVNLRVFWEGEEEAGSPHLSQVLEANKTLLKADLWLIGDAPVHQSRAPSLYFGARGSMGAQATVYGPLRPLHDGHYGNWAPNPAVMAATLITEMRDDEGHILIPGFADLVRPLNPTEQAALPALPPAEASLKREFGIGRSEGDEGLTASTLRPAINVRGIKSGGVGAEANNAIPSEAEVSIDFRLVPDQTPAAIQQKVEAFLAAKGWTVVAETPDLATRLAHPRIVKLQWETGYPALRTDMTLPVSKAVIAAAGRASGRPVVVLPMMGGSVPLYLFDAALKTPLIGLPIVNHDDSQHAPNENLRLQNLWDGIQIYAGLMGDLTW
jgi:acetylornithine deacetylase/succinyl-diaminopimelate desuccinylase-like protein